MTNTLSSDNCFYYSEKSPSTYSGSKQLLAGFSSNPYPVYREETFSQQWDLESIHLNSLKMLKFNVRIANFLQSTIEKIRLIGRENTTKALTKRKNFQTNSIKILLRIIIIRYNNYNYD